MGKLGSRQRPQRGGAMNVPSWIWILVGIILIIVILQMV
jgi:hypothetical protein